MSTATATATADVRTALAPRSLERPSLARLTAVELRKMTDTRAGFWLQFAVVALTIAVIAADVLFGNADDQTLREMLSIAVAPASILLPIVGILLVTSEWSQRTAMITFALVPRRPRVLAAKLLASVALSLIALALCIVVAVVGTAIAAPGIEHAWSLPVGLLGQHVVSLGTGMISGVALGAALLASAPAIVVSFAAPLVWAIAGRLAGLDTLGHWLDPTYSLAPMTEHLMSGLEWAHAGTTLALWMLLPLVVGLWRIQRGEIR
jgi:ABC-2 type transport system permease protein